LSDEAPLPMPTLADFLYVAYFAVVALVIDYRFFWPAFRRRSEADPARARRWLTAWTIGPAWVFVGIGAALWMANDRSWRSFGFSLPDGWRLWTSITLFLLLAAYHVWAIVSLVRSAEARASLRRQVGPLTAITPHTRTELYGFSAMSLTAGFCEEFLYRGYFICVCSPWLGWWGAAALSLLFFAIGHLYQGWNGVLRTGIVGAFFTLVVSIFGSLWPAIALHALIDVGAGVMSWLAQREGTADGDVVELEQPAEASHLEALR